LASLWERNAAIRNGKPSTTSTMPMMKVGRVPKWVLVESSACARAMIPVTMRMMPKRRWLVFDSLLTSAHCAFMVPGCHLLDLLARHPGAAGRSGALNSSSRAPLHSPGRSTPTEPSTVGPSRSRSAANVTTIRSRAGTWISGSSASAVMPAPACAGGAARPERRHDRGARCSSPRRRTPTPRPVPRTRSRRRWR